MEEGNGKFVRNEALSHVVAIGYHCAKAVQSNQDRGYSYHRRRIPFVDHDNRRWAEIPKDLSFIQVMNIFWGQIYFIVGLFWPKLTVVLQDMYLGKNCSTPIHRTVVL